MISAGVQTAKEKVMRCEKCHEPITGVNYIQIREKHWHTACFTQERAPEVKGALIVQTIKGNEASLTWVPDRPCAR